MEIHWQSLLTFSARTSDPVVKSTTEVEASCYCRSLWTFIFLLFLLHHSWVLQAPTLSGAFEIQPKHVFSHRSWQLRKRIRECLWKLSGLSQFALRKKTSITSSGSRVSSPSNRGSFLAVVFAGHTSGSTPQMFFLGAPRSPHPSAPALECRKNLFISKQH